MAGRARTRVLASFARKRDLKGTCRGLPGPGMLSAVSAFVCHGGVMACGLAPPEVAGLLVLCLFFELVPSVISSRLVTSGAALSIVLGSSQKSYVLHPVLPNLL